jgi:hypothetical protein
LTRNVLSRVMTRRRSRTPTRIVVGTVRHGRLTRNVTSRRLTRNVTSRRLTRNVISRRPTRNIMSRSLTREVTGRRLIRRCMVTARVMVIICKSLSKIRTRVWVNTPQKQEDDDEVARKATTKDGRIKVKMPA